MLRLYADFNSREYGDQNTVLLKVGAASPINKIDEATLSAGQRVIVECEDLECQGILRWSTAYNCWVADIVPETYVDLPEESWTRFRSK